MRYTTPRATAIFATVVVLSSAGTAMLITWLDKWSWITTVLVVSSVITALFAAVLVWSMPTVD